MQSRVHIHHQFDRELESVRSRVLSMGGLVERQVNDALTALRDGDSELADYVIRTDHRVNAQEVGIDEDCTYILARRQPAAGDLRTVMAIIKTITDLERIGDESEKIARMAKSDAMRAAPEATAVLEQIDAMGAMVTRLLHDALDTFARLNADGALATARQDEEIDRAYAAVLSELTECIKTSPSDVEYYQNLMWTTRALERVGDHAKNICEYVVYLVKGKDIRHISIDDVEKEIGK